MSDTRITTFYDLCEHLRISLGGGLADREQEDIRMAVETAYKNLIFSRNWQWYEKTLTIKPEVEDSGTSNLQYDQAASGNVEDATNTEPLGITSRGHGLAHGRVITVSGVLGNTAANGVWTVRTSGPDSFQLVGSAGNGAYTSGGTWHAHRQASFAVSDNPTFAVDTWTNGTPMQITSSGAHNLATGDAILIFGITGRLSLNGTWIVTVVDSTNFTLDGSVYSSSVPATGSIHTFDDGFPTWSDYGRLQIGNHVGQVSAKLNDVCVELDVDRNFGEDLEDQSWTMFRSDYQLPVHFHRPRLVIGQQSFDLGFLDLSSITFLERVIQTGGGPWHFTILQDPRERGRRVMRFNGYPSTDDLITIQYSGGPRRLKLTGYETRAGQGTLAMTAGDPNIVGTGTALAPDMVGCILRVSADSSKPTRLVGSNPYVEEIEIRSVGGSLKAVAQPGTLPTETRSGVGYIITDPIDASERMIDALENECLRTLYKLRRDWNSYNSMAKACHDSLSIAMETNDHIDYTGTQRGYAGRDEDSDYLRSKRGTTTPGWL